MMPTPDDLSPRERHASPERFPALSFCIKMSRWRQSEPDFWPTCIVAVEPEQAQTELADFEEHAIERGLIGQGTGKEGGAFLLVRDLHPSKPFLPGDIQLLFDPNATLHMLAYLTFQTHGLLG